MVSRNMQNYLRLVVKADFGQDGAKEYLADGEGDDALVDAYHEDVVIHRPPSLPQGGVHRGRDAWRAMHGIVRAHWDQKFKILNLWDVPEDDVIILNATMEWTGKETGRSAKVPFIGVLRFRDGLIVEVEIFHQDVVAILDTLDPA